MKIKRFPRLPDAQDEVIISVVNKLAKRYGKSESKGMSVLSDSIFAEPEIFVPTGIVPVDCVVSSGRGFPDGIIEIYGPPGAGKSAILEHLLAEAQKRGYYTSLFNQEYSFSMKRAIAVGIDQRKLVVHDAETIEDVFDEIKDFVRAVRKKDPETPIVIGWDTIAATPTRTEMKHEKGLDASDMGKMANQMSKLFRRLVRFLRKNHVCLACINQTRTNLGQMWGSKETTYGGAALRFYAWVRIRIKLEKVIKDGDKEIGIMSFLKVTKNKVDPPFRECRIPIFWKSGIDKYRSIWEYGVEQEVFKQDGRSYKWHGEIISRKKFEDFYENHKKKINKELREASRQ
jgi:recombination protein RecA